MLRRAVGAAASVPSEGLPVFSFFALPLRVQANSKFDENDILNFDFKFELACRMASPYIASMSILELVRLVRRAKRTRRAI